MLFQMFFLICAAKIYSMSSTIDDTISERLVDPSDVSHVSEQVNKEKLYVLYHKYNQR